MGRTRALLTDNDQTILEAEETGQSRYNARSAIRRRIRDELPDDLDILRIHEPGLWSTLQDHVCRTATDSVTTPRVTQTAGTVPDHLLTHLPVSETGQTALIQRTPTDTGYEALEDIVDTILESYLIEPRAGWFTIAQHAGSLQGNGADGFLHALHTPHSEFSDDPERFGSALYYARANHPDVSFVALSGQPNADETVLQNLQISVVGPEGKIELHNEVSNIGDFEESSFEASYFGGDTSTYHDLRNRLPLQPIEVIGHHRVAELASHPFEVLCSNPYYQDTDGWLDFLPTEHDDRSDEFLNHLAIQMASADRIRCFSTTDAVDTTLRAEEITVQHITGYSGAFDTTNLYLPVTPV